MVHLRVLLVAVCSTLAAGCTGDDADPARPTDGGPPAFFSPGTKASPVDAGSPAETPATTAPDAASGGNAEGKTPLSCDGLAAAGHPAELASFAWQIQREDCPSSACVDFIQLRAGCTLWYQKRNVPRTVALGRADCVALASWVTNGDFLTVLATREGCVPSFDVPESFEVGLADGTQFRGKTSACFTPALAGLRKCVAGLVERLFP